MSSEVEGLGDDNGALTVGLLDARKRCEGEWRIGRCIPSMAGIVVKPRARILHGHDWVFSSGFLSFRAKSRNL
jgi:hypothetical protein